jgi:predicted nuclease of restriction endonuclease-like (RecB) superfamily
MPPRSTTPLTLPADAQLDPLVRELEELIATSRERVASAANEALTALYWAIGHRVAVALLEGQRAAYGEQIVAALGEQLAARHGRGFGEKALRHMVRFASAFPSPEIVSALRRQLTWTHFKRLSYVEDELKRTFYAELCRIERWSTRELSERMDGMLYERTALARKPAEQIRGELAALRTRDSLTPLTVLRDPYMLDFLGLADTFSERDLESAILREIERFLLELGSGFAFLERQKRITLDGTDYYLDLLFFHRRLRRLVVVELKIGDFRPEFAGQVDLYLRWLDRHERQPGEEAPLGLILCAGKKQETVEILDLDARGIHVAEYLTALPPREVLEARLHEAVAAARSRLTARLDADGEETP